MAGRRTDDRSPGDQRQPYADIGGTEARHAQTHDVRREQLTNPTGPDRDAEDFSADIAPETPGAELGGHAEESAPATEDKALHERLDMLGGDELDRLAVLESGTRLEQGGTYLDLNDLARGPFKAIGGQEAEATNRYVAKRDTDYELWNRLVRRGDEPEVERPAQEAHAASS